MGKLPAAVLRRPVAATPSLTTATTSTSPSGILPSCQSRLLPKSQIRHATYIQRPQMPYKFTQLVQLSDGSTFTVRTMLPAAMYKSAKDSRNHLLWQPSNKSLHNVELDEAGKLAAFRGRYGRAFDLKTTRAADMEAKAGAAAAESDKSAEATTKPTEQSDPFDMMEDLIKGYAEADTSSGGLNAKAQAKKDKKKK